MLGLLLLFSHIPVIRSADCPKCPTGGLWSEWISSGKCATDCGACSTLAYTRKCLSEGIGCPCVGETSKTDVCRPETCNFSRTNSNIKACCKGTSMIINNLNQCGPLNASYTLECCPTGGYWSEWGVYSQKTDKIAWTRTRTCISAGHACPCEGNSQQVVYSCPCQDPINIPANDTTCQGQIGELAGYLPASDRVSRPQLTPIKSRCIAYSMLEVTNLFGEFVIRKNGEFRNILVSVDGDGKCSRHEFDPKISKIYTNGVIQRVHFECNLETLKYQLSGTSLTNIVKFSQFYKAA